MKTATVTMLENRNRLVAHSCREAFLHEKNRDTWDWLYLPLRALTLLRRGRDRIVLPRHKLMEEFVEFWCRLFRLRDDQVLWVEPEHYLLDDNIRTQLLLEIMRYDPDEWVIMPYSVTHEFLGWAKKTAIPVFGDNPKVIESWGNKGCLHPSPEPSRRPAGLPLLASPDIRVPRGYTCATAEDLRAAWHLLTKQGERACIRKPGEGTTGDGIVKITRPTELLRGAFQVSPIEVLEECVSIRGGSDGRPLTPSAQFNGDELLGILSQAVSDTYSFSGNGFPVSDLARFEIDAMTSMAQAVIREVRPHGPGGLDFLVADGDGPGTILLIDPNLGRSTGAHPLQFFRRQWAPPDMACVTRKLQSADLCGSIATYWNRLRVRGLAFEPHSTRGGVVWDDASARIRYP